MRDLLSRLADGRSFSRIAHPSGLDNAQRSAPPLHVGTGYEDAYITSPEFLITAKDLEARRTFADTEPGLGRLVFVFHLDGRRTIELKGIGRYELNRPTFAAYYQAEGICKRSIWARGDCEKAVLVGFWARNPPEILRKTIAASADWQSMFAVEERPFVWFQQPLSFEMEQAARLILAPKIHTILLPHFLKAKAHELLCLGFEAILSAFDVSSQREYSLSSKLCQAQRLIDANILALPLITDLAKEVALPPPTLSAEFRSRYGMTITEYASKERMRKARLLLISTNAPLKKIAHELGYNHASNFCLAFKRHFGITPRHMRLGAGSK